MVQIPGQPAAGWTEAESLLGGDKAPLSESTEAVWAWQDRAKKAAKAVDEKRPSLLATYGDVFSVLCCRHYSARASASGHFCLRIFFSLKCGLERPGQWRQRIGSLLRLLRMQPAYWEGLVSVDSLTCYGNIAESSL